MGVDALQESLLVDEAAVNCALVSLSHALQFQLGDSLPDLHVLRGRCLHLKGEDQNAADCFKQAVELERPGSTDTTALRCLLQALLSVFMQGGPDPSTAIGQLEMWVQKAEERYPNDIVKAELRCLYRTQTAEVTELSRALIRAGRLDLVKRLLETIVPKQLAKKKTVTRSFSFTWGQIIWDFKYSGLLWLVGRSGPAQKLWKGEINESGSDWVRTRKSQQKSSWKSLIL